MIEKKVTSQKMGSDLWIFNPLTQNKATLCAKTSKKPGRRQLKKNN